MYKKEHLTQIHYSVAARLKLLDLIFTLVLCKRAEVLYHCWLLTLELGLLLSERLGEAVFDIVSHHCSYDMHCTDALLFDRLYRTSLVLDAEQANCPAVALSMQIVTVNFSLKRTDDNINETQFLPIC